ncbi:MAG TPA: endolytic transglycosylase MltG [Chloroflexota bacterium]
MANRQVTGRTRELSAVRRSRVQRTGGNRMFRRPNSGGGGGGIAGLVLLVALLGVVGALYIGGRDVLSASPNATASPSSDTATTASVVSQQATVATSQRSVASGQSVPFVVKSGDTWTDVANQLQQQGLISSAMVFRIQVRLTGSNGAMEAGTYTLKQGMTTDQIIAVLEHATPPVSVSVRFTEGWRMEQDAAQLEKQGVGTATDFLSVTKSQSANFNDAFLADRPSGASLEGYLFPDTYDFLQKAPAADIVTKMLTRFGEQVTPAMIAQAKAQGHTLYQVLIVASIVEREAAVPSERSLIAGVYWNRIKLGQCMCADPTVQYALGQSSNWWPTLNAEARTLAPDSPFNTYNHLGFPPGPICSPGLASIQAALSPTGDYLYFVAKGDGTHVFSHTLQEQTQNQLRIQPSSTK